MSALPVEWILLVNYNVSAHRAVYGRIGRKHERKIYTKDYIQLSKKPEFIETLASLFPIMFSSDGSAPLIYKWPKGTTPGALIRESADRPHLKWETSLGAPQVWKMSLAPNETSAETIPGDPSHTDITSAEEEFDLLGQRGAGQPYLLAVKLRDEPDTLHLRAYLESPDQKYAWASIQHTPMIVRTLATRTSQHSAIAHQLVQSIGASPSTEINKILEQLMASNDLPHTLQSLEADAAQKLSIYLKSPATGLYFYPDRNHDAWVEPAVLSEDLKASIPELLMQLDTHFPSTQGDATAELLDTSAEETDAFRVQIKQKNYSVLDAHSTVKTRGSAQRAFAETVKKNYGFECAITGIKTRDFLIASHIVPWSADQHIRLDPTNGICLSLLVDRAFEAGYLVIAEDFTVHIDWDRVGDDEALKKLLQPYQGQRLALPKKEAPQIEYLERRRKLITPRNP